ncbi:COG0742 N6-adenine-specific methylase [Candidatus Methylopumilus universalis]|uniref:16S rRNA (guanine(966)-N(2))-methyltransferase RsmD n=1 Tax=Candidatus Methylopumilus universalis TaxID=2588536 RepID=UPI003BEF224E
MKTVKNQVKIIGGEWKRKNISFIDSPGLRPTPGRVRETLFNWLEQDLTGKVCLDLFSGSGVIGFESLSRGAKNVVMIEKSPHVFKMIQENQKLLQADGAVLQLTDALAFLEKNTTKFDIIFCDPPFNESWEGKLFPQLANHLAEDGLIYFESEASIKEYNVFNIAKKRKAGNVFYHLVTLKNNDSI